MSNPFPSCIAVQITLLMSFHLANILNVWHISHQRHDTADVFNLFAKLLSLKFIWLVTKSKMFASALISETPLSNIIGPVGKVRLYAKGHRVTLGWCFTTPRWKGARIKKKVINDWSAPDDSSYVNNKLFSKSTLSFIFYDLPLDVQGVALSACYQEPAEENRKDLWRLESSPPSFRWAVLCAEVRNPRGTPGSTPALTCRLWQGLQWPLKICRGIRMSLYSWKRQQTLWTTIKKKKVILI